MSFEVDRYSSAWAHIALCADLTWATEPPDEFIIANQRLWAQHCRVSQVLQETTLEQSLQTSNQCEQDNKRSISSQSQENGSSSGRKSVKDVIPESRLAQFYGNFYYDEVRWSTGFASCLTIRRTAACSRAAAASTECYLTRISSERWGPLGARGRGEEAALAARVRSVRELWACAPSPPSALWARAPSPPSSPPALWARAPSPPSPPPAPRKMRARRRQPRRLATPTPPPYCLDVPPQLFCDPTCKFQFEPPRPPLGECQRAMGRLSASVQAVLRASARCPPYRGTNVSRYAPTGPRPARPERRCGVWWPRDHPSPRLDHRFHLMHAYPTAAKPPATTEPEDKKPEPGPSEENQTTNEQTTPEPQTPEKPDTPTPTVQEKVASDGQMPSTSAAALETGRKKRLYSTVLSMSAPAPISLTQVGCVRLAQKLVTPGLLKLNPKIVLPGSRIRPPNVDHKFEELEKEALEQYKASDESIDTKFRELENQAVEQYSASNSNTSCSSCTSAKRAPQLPDPDHSTKHAAKFHKEKPVDSVVIYSQNFPDLNSKQTSSVMNLKNFHTPPRGEKKEQTHRSNKNVRVKNESQRAASDTDYEAREAKFPGSHKGPLRWTLHVVSPKKRHLALCASDYSSDEELDDGRKAAPCLKNHAGKLKMAAHGGGDLHPIMRKT